MTAPKRNRNNEEKASDANDRKALFLKAIEEHGTVLSACRVAGVPRGTYQRWTQTDPDVVCRVFRRSCTEPGSES